MGSGTEIKADARLGPGGGWSEGCNYLFLGSITPEGRGGHRAAAAAAATVAEKSGTRASAGGERDGK